jgi:NYN domain
LLERIEDDYGKEEKANDRRARRLSAPCRAGKGHIVAPVALLIDGENVAIPDLLAHVLVEAGRMGGVTIRHVYGNWSAPVMQGWKKYLDHYGLEAKGNRAGSNATDIALVIGAMDLL